MTRLSARQRTGVPGTLELVAAPVEATPSQWGLNGRVPGPTIRARTGDRLRVELTNELPEPTILHWHGLDVPEEADGHPRLAVDPGQRYAYDFTVEDRAGTYWYHPHPDRRTGIQTYRGLAGFLLIEDDEEAALGLPSDDHELPLLLQDRRLDRDGTPVFALSGPERMTGFLGDRGFVNGVERPTVDVERAAYRLRLLNGSNARLLQLAFDPVLPMTLIGSDGGLLERAATVERILLGTGERADVLVDFSGLTAGQRLTLRSEAFRLPGPMGGMGGMGRMGRGGRGRPGFTPQGALMPFLDIHVVDSPTRPLGPLTGRISSIARPLVSDDTWRRRLRFESAMHEHTINGRGFDMHRARFEVPLGRTEVWELVNVGPMPHPVHVHAGQFHVLSRRGGRNRLEPWETGLKDTVLLLPDERVEIAVRFARHPGLFLVHCHNLEHEDHGMMANFAVTASA